MGSRQAVSAVVQRARVHAHAQTSSGKPHQRRSSLTFPNGTVVLDTVTATRGVVLSGRVTHVPDSRAPRRAGDSPTFSLKVPATVRVEHYSVELASHETVARTAAELTLVAAAS